jgi:hypothetical protein
MSGGPVISRSSRNVVAVFSDIEMRKAMGIRIDTIGNLLKFDKDLFNKELDAISRIGGFVSMFESEKAQFESKILEFKEKVDHFKKIGGGKVYVVKAAMERESKAFVKNVRSVIPEKGWSLPFVKEKYDLELKKAGEVLNSFNRLKAELDDVYKKSNQIN